LYLSPIAESRATEVSDFFIKRTALLLVVASGLALLFAMTRAVRSFRGGWMATTLTARSAFLLLPIVLTTAVYLLRCVHTQWPALRFLAAHGVMGSSPYAKWVGVSDYLRARTPAASSVLALTRDHRGTRLDEGLRVRTGRAMPMTRPGAVYLSCEKASHFIEQQWLWTQITDLWDRRDWPGLSQTLTTIRSPDYLVVPAADAQWLGDVRDPGYQAEATIHGFTILRRRS
jgi:hypothetical protein